MTGHPVPPFDTALFKEAMGRFTTGVTIVSGIDDGKPVGFTCQSFVSLSIDPPYVAVAPARTSTSWPRIESSGTFAVNVLADDQEELCRGFATKGGDKFAGVGWSPGPFSGAPVLTGALAWLECRLEQLHDAGDHLIAVGRVLDLQAREGRPLLFFRGGYGRFDV